MPRPGSSGLSGRYCTHRAAAETGRAADAASRAGQGGRGGRGILGETGTEGEIEGTIEERGLANRRPSPRIALGRVTSRRRPTLGSRDGSPQCASSVALELHHELHHTTHVKPDNEEKSQHPKCHAQPWRR